MRRIKSLWGRRTTPYVAGRFALLALLATVFVSSAAIACGETVEVPVTREVTVVQTVQVQVPVEVRKKLYAL